MADARQAMKRGYAYGDATCREMVISIREQFKNPEIIAEALERQAIDAEMKAARLPEGLRFGKVDIASKEITVHPESILQNLQKF